MDGSTEGQRKTPTLILSSGRSMHKTAMRPPSFLCHVACSSTGRSSEAPSRSAVEHEQQQNMAVCCPGDSSPLARCSADLQLLPGLLNGECTVHAMLVVQVNLVNAQARQGGLAGCPNVLGGAIHLQLACRR